MPTATIIRVYPRSSTSRVSFGNPKSPVTPDRQLICTTMPQPSEHLRRLDTSMEASPWMPRIAPWALYLIFLFAISSISDQWPISYPFMYTIQCVAVVWLMVRYRKLLPELTFRFHWLAVPVGIGVAWMWVTIGDWITTMRPGWFQDIGTKPFFDEDQMGPIYGWLAMVLRLLGMSIAVPMFEELFNRSLLLRSLHRARPTGVGVLQALHDMPMIGDWLVTTKWGSQIGSQPPAFRAQFDSTSYGRLSVFGVLASTAVFVSVHHPRDWVACFLCGVIYCLVVGATRRHGLGPVIWTHGITNASLWGYTIYCHYTSEQTVTLWPYL